MPRALSIALATLLLVACGGSPQSQLIGTWALDAESFKETDEYKNASEEDRQAMTAMMGMMKMEITFTDSKAIMSMEMMGQKQNEEHDYRVVKEEGNRLTLESTDKNGKTETVVVQIDGDTLLFDDGSSKMALKRK